MKLWEVAIFRFLPLENGVSSVDPFGSGGCLYMNSLGLEASGAAVDDYTVDTRISRLLATGKYWGADRCSWRFSASFGPLGGCSISGGYALLSKARASAWHWRRVE